MPVIEIITLIGVGFVTALFLVAVLIVWYLLDTLTGVD